MKNTIKNLLTWPIRKIKNFTAKFKTHIVYLLIIGNMIIWSHAYLTGSQWYNEYIDLGVSRAEAKTIITEEGIVSSPIPSVGSQEWALWYVEKEGIDPVKVNCLITKESGWNPNATHVNTNGSVDMGLFMWNDYWQIKKAKFITMECIGDVICETYKFVEKVKADKSFGAWHGYTNHCLHLGTNPFII
jgi:hypothetical protein